MDEDASDLPGKDEFRSWLKEQSTLGARTVSDTVSRTRRITRLIDLGSAKSADDIEVMTLRAPGFMTCSPSVRSQLKRAALLYIQFRARAQS